MVKLALHELRSADKYNRKANAKVWQRWQH
jgi:hypothetical protein